MRPWGLNRRLPSLPNLPLMGALGWSPDMLFAAGQAGHWAEYNPATGLLFQDAAGTTPATLPDQPVGRSNRLVGTVDATQETALSRPTLARWPKGGRRNLLTTSELSDSAAGRWPRRIGTTLEPVADGFRLTRSGANTDNSWGIDQVITGWWSANPNMSNCLTVEAKAGTASLLRIFVGTTGHSAIFNLVNGTVQSVSNGSTATIIPVGNGWYRCTLTRLGLTVTTPSYSIRIQSTTNDGEYIDIRRPQGELGQVTDYQNVTTQNNITESGVPSVWHLWNDGGDSLAMTAPLPAGTYGLAYYSLDLGQGIIGEIPSDGSTPLDTSMLGRWASLIIRQGAFTAGEATNLTAYFAGFPPAETAPPPELFRSFALTSPDTGAAWITPDGLMLVTPQEAP